MKLELKNLPKLDILTSGNALGLETISDLGGCKVYKLNIYCLKFNPYNDRFAAEIEKYELEKKVNLAFDESSQFYLFQLLSGVKANIQTKENILIRDIVKPIVIDNRGIILDGNRRISILRQIVENDKKHVFKFVRVLLIEEDNISKKRIHEIETLLNSDEDERDPYETINNVLKIQRLLANSEESGDDKFLDVAKKMGVGNTSKKIKNSNLLFQEMKKYLNYYEKFDKTLLQKRLDHFESMLRFKQSIDSKQLKTNDIDYLNNLEMFEKAKQVCYVLISFLFEGKKFRKIFPTKKKSSGLLAYSYSLNSVYSKFKKENWFNYAKENTSISISKEQMKLLIFYVKEANQLQEDGNVSDKLLYLINKIERDTNIVYNMINDNLKDNKPIHNVFERLSSIKDFFDEILRKFNDS